MLKFRLKQKLLPWLFGNAFPNLFLLLAGTISLNSYAQVGVDSTGAPQQAPAPPPVVAPAPVPPQVGERTISGVVKDQKGEPVIGATVSVKGTNIGVVTDENGAFTVKVPEANAGGTLVIAYVGYTTLELPLATTTNFDLVLQDVEIEEVVVVGYGTQEKEDVTGAISSVKGADLAKVVVTDPSQAIQGRAPGVTVTQNSGSPGSPLSIRVRGVGTVGNASPIYVVNGMPVTDISYLNTNDIESIDVLKDASSAAIYGNRAANGVILITTKKGSPKKATFDFAYLTGFSKPWKRYQLLDANQWAVLKNESLMGNGQAPAYNPDTIGSGTNWQDQIFTTGRMNSYFLSAAGGTEKTTYYLGGGYLSQGGIVRNSSYDRYNFNVNVVTNATKRITLGAYSNISYSDRLVANDAGDYTSVLSGALAMNPMTGIYSGRGGDSIYAAHPQGDAYNPVAQINNRTNRVKGLSYLGYFYGEYKILKSLTFRTNVGANFSNNNTSDFRNSYYLKPGQSQSANSITKQIDENGSVLWENSLKFDDTFLDKHHVTALALWGVQDTRLEFVKTVATNTPSNDASNQYLSAATSASATASGTVSESFLLSYLGRLNYEYSNKYLLTANIRRDATSRFSKANRVGLFPSVAAGWKISEENFFAPLRSTISFLKLRGGWGQVGNQNLSGVLMDYPTATSVYTGQNYSFGDSVATGSAPQSVGNPNLKWETVTTANIALDMAFFNNRLTFTVDYFTRTTTDMLLQKKVPSVVGLEVNPYVNGGKITNRGLELSAEYRNQYKDVKYRIGGNITFIKNKVIDVGDPIYDGQFRGNLINVTQNGGTVGQFYGYQTDGIVQTQAEAQALQSYQPGVQAGDFKYKDVNGDGKIDANDRTNIGSPIPKFTYGFYADVNWKNFDLTMLWQGSYGNKIFNGSKYVLESSDMTNYNNKDVKMLDRWTGPGTSNTIPRVAENDPNNLLISNYYVESGSYLRLKVLQIGYTLPEAWTQRAKLQRVRIFVGAQNLLTFTKYSGLDPEIGNNNYATTNNTSNAVASPAASPLDFGIDRGGNYPQARTWQFGFNLSF